MMFQRPGALTVAALAFTIAGCGSDAPVQSSSQHSHQSGIALASLSTAATAQTLNDLTALTAPFHDVDAAEAAGYSLFKAPPLTALGGCISGASDGGMGYHTVGSTTSATTRSACSIGVLRLRAKRTVLAQRRSEKETAAFDYFIPYSEKWPGPDNPIQARADAARFSTMRDLPDIAFAPSRFQGWMFHIWLWEQNPAGMFTNWNTSVPLCEGSSF
jgi:hypothetical protein